MSITFKKIDTLKLTIFSVNGPFSMDEWLKTIEEYNRSGATSLELYDIRKGSGQFDGNNAMELHYRTRPETSIRTKDDRTAILAGRPSLYGLARIYTAYADIGGVPWQVEVFYSIEEASRWLGVDLKDLVPES